ncbi:MAG TPA: cytochrome c oxidase subunit II [Candidatus Limnocylindrales bacterium]
MTRRCFACQVAILGALGALASGCIPQAATTQGQSINSLYTVALAMSAVVAALVWGLITWSVIRYRRGKRASDELPPQTSGSQVLEIIWTAGPLIAIVILFTATLLTLNVVNAAPQQGAVQLNVEAFRWGWRMTYPNDGVSVEGVLAPGPQAVLPVGREVQINLTSADVIHSFFVPQFLYKKDAIPGHPNSFTITIAEPGTYAGQCAEFCGVFHSQMPFTIRAVSDTDYRAWLSSERAAGSTPGATP